MKFSNGHWLLREGYKAYAPAEVYDMEVSETEVRFFTPSQHILNKGMTLGGVALTILVSSPGEDMIRVRTYHHFGAAMDKKGFEIDDKKVALQVEDTKDEIKITSGCLSLKITKNPWTMEYLYDGKVLTNSIGTDLAMLKTNDRGDAYDKGDEVDTYMRQQFSLDVGELIYGLGEHFGPFVKNGQSIEMWNADGGTGTEQAYKNIPFFLSNKGYGVFVNHPEKVEYEIGTEYVTKAAFSVKGGYLDYVFCGGESMKGAISAYTSLTGKPSVPAPWTFGLWLSTSFTTDYDENTVMSFIDGMKERGIALRTFHFDCCWMKEFHWTDFLWDERVFPDPAGMLSRIKAKGLNICVWINSYIAQESALFREGMENGYFIKKPNGHVFQWDMWQPGMAIVDFTNPAAREWFGSKLEKLMDMGVDCFKTDFGERIPEDGVYYDGSDPMVMHNYYTYLYNKCVYDVIEKKRGKGEAVLFARSATVGGQKFPVHWGGDCYSDYPSMAESLRGGLSLMLSGFGFWAHDIGGFESTSTPDVYKRWVAFGLFSSHSRLHGSSSYRVPWLYDEEAVDVVRFFTSWKARLMPYIYTTAIETGKTGVPLVRPMILEFQDDPNCGYLDKQYMFGESMLVAPILNDKGIGECYLPEGKWTDFFTGEMVEGGKWIKKNYDYLSLPVFVKENAILPIGSHTDKPDYDYIEDIELWLYMHTESGETKCKVCDQDGKEKINISAKWNGNDLKIISNLSNKIAIRLKHRTAKNVSGAECMTDNGESVLMVNAKETTITLN